MFPWLFSGANISQFLIYLQKGGAVQIFRMVDTEETSLLKINGLKTNLSKKPNSPETIKEIFISAILPLCLRLRLLLSLKASKNVEECV